MVMREVDIGLIPYTIIHITTANYELSTRGPPNNLFQGVYKEKLFKKFIKEASYINIKIIHIFLHIQA